MLAWDTLLVTAIYETSLTGITFSFERSEIFTGKWHWTARGRDGELRHEAPRLLDSLAEAQQEAEHWYVHSGYRPALVNTAMNWRHEANNTYTTWVGDTLCVVMPDSPRALWLIYVMDRANGQIEMIRSMSGFGANKDDAMKRVAEALKSKQ